MEEKNVKEKESNISKVKKRKSSDLAQVLSKEPEFSFYKHSKIINFLNEKWIAFRGMTFWNH